MHDNTITLKADHQDESPSGSTRPLVDLTKPVTVEVSGARPQTFTLKPNLETYCLGLEERGDPRLAAPGGSRSI